MKKLLLTALLGLCAAAGHAQAYDYLTVEQADGNRQSFATTGGLRITFQGDLARVKPAGAAETQLALDGLAAMFFESTPTDIAAPDADTPDARPDAVYSLDGRRLAGGMSRLPMREGVYIVRSNGKTRKLLVR